MWDGISSNERILKSHSFGSFCFFGLCIMCVKSMLDVLSSEYEDDISPLTINVPQCLEPYLEVAGQSRSGKRVDSILENYELARTALSCHLSMDLLKMSDAW